MEKINWTSKTIELVELNGCCSFEIDGVSPPSHPRALSICFHGLRGAGGNLEPREHPALGIKLKCTK